MSAEERVIDSITDWVAQTAPEGRGLLLPVSGGSDSALASYILGQTGVEPVTGVYFGNDLPRGRDWFEAQIPVEIVELPDSNLDPEVARWAHILTRGLAEHEVIVGTRNRTEGILGAYSTASKIAAILPLAGIWKSDIMKLCEYVGVPKEIIASSRQADADCGRPNDLAAIPFDKLDAFLKVKTGELPGDTELLIGATELEYLETVYTRNRFKEKLPYTGPIVEIG